MIFEDKVYSIKAILISGNLYEMAMVNVYIEKDSRIPHIPLFTTYKNGFYRLVRVTEKNDLATYRYDSEIKGESVK